MEHLQYIGSLGIPLLILSLIGFAIIIERFFFYLKLPDINNCPALIHMEKTLQNNAKKPKELRDEIISHLLLDTKKTHEFGIRILRIIAVTSPMLGLLGTVIGIIGSFKIISLHQGPVYPALIADGLWTAMLTTAVGLAIALPCLFSSFIFLRLGEKRIEKYQKKLNQISFEIEGVKLD